LPCPGGTHSDTRAESNSTSELTHQNGGRSLPTQREIRWKLSEHMVRTLLVSTCLLIAMAWVWTSRSTPDQSPPTGTLVTMGASPGTQATAESLPTTRRPNDGDPGVPEAQAPPIRTRSTAHPLTSPGTRMPEPIPRPPGPTATGVETEPQPTCTNPGEHTDKPRKRLLPRCTGPTRLPPPVPAPTAPPLEDPGP
jgi:hypothetical protein